MSNLNKKTKVFILLIAIIAIIIFAYLINNYDITNINSFVFWSVLSIIVESLLILLPSGAGISVGFAISLALIIIEGPFIAALVTVIGVTFRVVKLKNRRYVHILNTPFYKIIFNISQGIIVTGLSGILFIYINQFLHSKNFEFSIFTVLIIMVFHTVLNSIILSILFSLLSKEKFFKVWFGNIKGVYLSAIAVCMLGVIIALAYMSYGPGAVLLFFGPLLLARYSFKLYIDMKNIYLETIQALIKAIEAKDPYTSGHACRVEEYAVKLAKTLRLSDKQIENIKTAALLHDIGKIGIDDSILKKPGRLTEEEYQIIQQHPVIGAQIIKDVDILKGVVDIVKYHHERYDGKGYPDGLKGNNIPIEAAILAIADVFDAMTSDRPYRPAFTKEQALEEIEKNSGTQFNPEAAKAFAKILRREIKEEMLANAN